MNITPIKKNKNQLDLMSQELANSINDLKNKDFEEIKNLFPESWTHHKNLDILKIGFGLKLNGIDWRTEKDLGAFMVFARTVGLIEIDAYLVRRGLRTFV